MNGIPDITETVLNDLGGFSGLRSFWRLDQGLSGNDLERIQK
jgi:hypothetical protein